MPPRWCFLRVDTDEGISGWGEPIVEGRARTIVAAIGELAGYLVGTDPMRIQHQWQTLTKGGFYRGGPLLSSAVAGIDQALWDITGKALGVPVYQLLGGRVRDRIRIYTHVDGDPATIADQIRARLTQGYTAIKLALPPQRRILETPQVVRETVDLVAAAREAAGDDVDLAVDFHGRLSLPAARRILPLLEPMLPLFVEEPVVPELSGRLTEITRATTIPVATGERLYSRWDFAPVLDAGVAVVQPDVSHAGGISEVFRIAALAESYDAAIAPHCPLGPITLAASLQIGLAVPNLLLQEQSLDLHAYTGPSSPSMLDYLADPGVFGFRDGWVDPLAGPGLGIDIDEDALVRAAARSHDWRNPLIARDDGSRAEW